MALPRIRPLEAFPFENEGANYICLSDPSGIIEEQLILSAPAYLVAMGMDGKRGGEELKTYVARHLGGMMVPDTVLDEVVTKLNLHGFLDTDVFQARRQAVEEAYRDAPFRKANFAGKAYPSDPAELRTYLDGLFLRDGGPGSKPTVSHSDSPMPGLVVPHIDFQRGGLTYAHGYHAMAKSGAPETVIIFGVAHVSQPAPFVLTRKPFDTPLGTLELDTEILDALESVCQWDPYQYELVHRTEHSIEFQAVMIAHVFGPSVRIVPILCSHFPSENEAATPTDDPGVTAFLNTCAHHAARKDKRITVIASADLAHVGRRFGDEIDIDDGVIASVRRRDDEDLAFASRVEGDGFYRSVMKDHNDRKVCGINCIYATLKTLEGTAQRGTQLHYDYAPDPAGGIVSFASMALA